MQKNRKASTSSVETRSPRRYQLSAPEVVTVDVLGTMLDEDLVTRLRALDDEKNRIYENGGADPRPWEEEVAYVRREQQIRRARRDSHAEYVQKAEGEFNRLEASLPAGDFDNSAFVNAANGGRPRWN